MLAPMGVFHYPLKQLPGWTHAPTDYYPRPWHVWNYRYLHNDTTNRHCINTEPYFEHQMSITEEFMTKFSREYHFSFTFTTESTHENPAFLGFYDDILHTTLRRLYYEGRLNRTALVSALLDFFIRKSSQVVMGDHGHRVGLIRNTHSGRIEERQPFFAIYLPQWWKNKHKDWLHNFRFNKHRLVTNFDIHHTLMDIVYESEEDTYISPGTQKGLSLFRNRLSPDRQCYDVGIGQCLLSSLCEHFLKHNQANSTARVWKSTRTPSFQSAFNS